MDKLKKHWKRIRLPLIFAIIVLVILIITMILVISSIYLLSVFGIVENKSVEIVPLPIFAISSIMVGTILAAISSGIPLTPVQKIMDAIDAIADGEYSVRLNLRGPEEFRTLSNKFNHMAQELGSVEMLRSDFVNNFSHEFKTPIVSIRGFARALKWDDLTPEEREEYLDIIITESERLAELSSNVLYLSKLENQAILTDKQAFDLTEQIRLVIALLHSKMTDKNLEIIYDCDEYFIKGNEEMLKQVWINLLDNAIKFSPESGNVQITISEKEDTLICTITNSGPTIPPDKLAHIFEKFYQADHSHSEKGNGVGLAIVKRVIELHSGEISVSSEDDRTMFTVILPKECCAQ